MARAYQPDPKFFTELAVGKEIRAACREIADKGKGIAEGLAQDFRITGEYADSFEVSDETIPWTGSYPGARAAAFLTNTAPYAASVEWGYEGRSEAETSSAHRVLGRTADALGGA